MSEDPNTPITPEDFLYVLEVCSSEVSAATLNPRGILHARRGLLDALRCCLWRLQPESFSRKVAQWVRYQRDYVSPPQQMEAVEPDGETVSESSAGELTGPYYLARVCSVLKQYPGAITEHRAWTMPLGLLIWMDEQGKELEGAGRPFWNAAEEDAIDRALEEAEAHGQQLLRERRK